MVKAGDVRFTVEDAPYRVAMQQADAQIATAQARITALQADVGAAAADIAAARDDYELARKTYQREQALMDRGFNSRARLDVAEHRVAAARDRIVALQADVEKARRSSPTGRSCRA